MTDRNKLIFCTFPNFYIILPQGRPPNNFEVNLEMEFFVAISPKLRVLGGACDKEGL